MKKELKRKIGLLTLFFFVVVVGIVSYFLKDWIRYKLEVNSFKNIINQCSVEVHENSEDLTQEEIFKLIEECVELRNKNTKFNYKAN